MAPQRGVRGCLHGAESGGYGRHAQTCCGYRKPHPGGTREGVPKVVESRSAPIVTASAVSGHWIDPDSILRVHRHFSKARAMGRVVGPRDAVEHRRTGPSATRSGIVLRIGPDVHLQTACRMGVQPSCILI